MSEFFINRPIVAMVIAILTVIVGAVTIVTLPVAQFPSIVPPEVQIQATYVGADAETLAQSVATPIEQQMSGVDNMNYMYSLNATGNGQMTMIVDFDVKTDPNQDLILAQMRETLAASQLPSDVTNYGVTVQKSVISPLMLISLYSPNNTYDAKFLSNYAYINLHDPLTRSPGVGIVQIFGAGQYAMRMWVNPDQLAKLGITVTDMIGAIQAQNTVNPGGQAGGEPAPKGQEYTYAVRAQGRLISPEEFGQIVVRETTDGGIVRVKDVARVELGTQDYSTLSRLNGNSGAIVAIYQLPGSNAVSAAAGVNKLMAEMKKRIPQDMY
jgi:HAE1 family hydrophobic/amphiphilic exporter-1